MTKQAAQKRFMLGLTALDRPDGSLNRFTPRARSVLAQAQAQAEAEARAMSRRQVGTGHVLLGLLGEPDGLARPGHRGSRRHPGADQGAGRGQPRPGRSGRR
ncbi:MAG: Clp protease N-terminal domain-containing protein [Actinomycetota bacterium]